MLKVKIFVLMSLGIILNPINVCYSTTAQDVENSGADNSYDGLYLIKQSQWDKTWVKPGVDFSSYTRVIIKKPEIAFKIVDSNNIRLRRKLNETEFSMSEANKQKITEEIVTTFKQTLSTNKAFQVSDKAAQDVIRVEVSVIDIVSHVPPEPFGVSDIYIKSFAKATLVLELKDALSGEILLRTVDHKAAERFGEFVKVSRITEVTELRRLVKRWAIQTNNRLKTVTKLSQ